MDNVKTADYMEICRTGKLQQYYTLYIHRSVVSGSFCLESYRFVQNLAMDEDLAYDKGQALYDHRKKVMTDSWGEENYHISMDMVDSPKREYCDLKAFGYEWHKTTKGFVTTPDKKFWSIWKSHKTALKEAGFRVIKVDTTNCFIIFFGNTTDEKMYDAFEVMKDKMDNQVVTGKHMGELKERLKNLSVYVESVFIKHGFYGDQQVVKFSHGDHIFTSFYSGRTEIKQDTNVLLTGTVKGHDVYDGKNVTVLNRIIVNEIK